MRLDKELYDIKPETQSSFQEVIRDFLHGVTPTFEPSHPDVKWSSVRSFLNDLNEELKNRRNSKLLRARAALAFSMLRDSVYTNAPRRFMDQLTLQDKMRSFAYGNAKVNVIYDPEDPTNNAT